MCRMSENSKFSLTLAQNHRIIVIEQFGLDETLGSPRFNPPAMGREISSGNSF